MTAHAEVISLSEQNFDTILNTSFRSQETRQGESEFNTTKKILEQFGFSMEVFYHGRWNAFLKEGVSTQAKDWLCKVTQKSRISTDNNSQKITFCLYQPARGAINNKIEISIESSSSEETAYAGDVIKVSGKVSIGLEENYYDFTNNLKTFKPKYVYIDNATYKFVSKSK